MQKLISIILALLMTIFGSFFPGLFGKDAEPGLTTGEWLTAVVEEFGMSENDYSSTPYYANVPATSEYFAVVQIAYEWEIIGDDDVLDLDAKVTNAFIFKTLKNAISDNLSGLGLIDNKKTATLASAIKWLDGAKDIWANRSFDETPVADVTTNAAGEVEKVDIEGSFAPDFAAATILGPKGEVIQEGATGPQVGEQGLAQDLLNKGIDAVKGLAQDFLANPAVSFDVSGIKISAAYDVATGRVDLGVSGNVVDNVKLEKYYTLSNINVNTKYDATLIPLKIREAYVVMDYDLVETTVITGSYAASVVPDASAIDSGADFLTKVKQGLGSLKLVEGGGIKVKVFSFSFPIGSTPFTFDMDVSLTISAVGRIEIIVSSNETKGFEIINNKGRVISDSNIVDRLYNITGDFKVVLGLTFALSGFGFKLIDVDVQGGIGALVYTRIFNKITSETSALDVPLDIVIEASSGLDALANLDFTTDVTLYGILRISVGENSILAGIGLKKAWTIYDINNGVFATLHIDSTGVSYATV